MLDEPIVGTKAGEVRVETAIEGGRAHITVADTGPGLDPEIFRTSSSASIGAGNTDGVTGTGLGLSIARGWLSSVEEASRSRASRAGPPASSSSCR